MYLSPDQILSWIDRDKYAVIFPLTVVEGPIVTIVSAFLASQGHLEIRYLYPVALAGDMVGDYLHYVFGRWLDGRALRGFQRRFVSLAATARKSIGYLSHNPGKTIVFSKWMQAPGFIVLIGSGIARVPVWKFLWYCLLGTAPKLAVFVLVGYFFGEAYREIDAYIGKGTAVAFALMAAALVALHWYFRRKNP